MPKDGPTAIGRLKQIGHPSAEAFSVPALAEDAELDVDIGKHLANYEYLVDLGVDRQAVLALALLGQSSKAHYDATIEILENLGKAVPPLDASRYVSSMVTAARVRLDRPPDNHEDFAQ